MSGSGGWSVRRPDAVGRRVPRTLRGLERRPFDAPLQDAEGPAPVADTVPTILVAGIVSHLERIQDLGYIQRARWSFERGTERRNFAGMPSSSLAGSIAQSTDSASSRPRITSAVAWESNSPKMHQGSPAASSSMAPESRAPVSIPEPPVGPESQAPSARFYSKSIGQTCRVLAADRVR